ncbi:PseudoU_synth_1 domain-containing protein [Cephalotus follicularis]|uniref:PseudoU_synth_1 domain-containing protein n=1 Tax=Cephalotus follicularis TaxID=3775 RepID=A0A1Q3AMC7_CEPFO|nr:PseudoU_synth_1 domain-containing protein [Cephalotus follicularis]
MEDPETKNQITPQPQLEPDPKRLKMSTTSDEEVTDNSTITKQRYKRRKIAIFFAYCGVGYQGMQKNPGAKTIESDLEEALYLSGAVPEQDRNNSKRYDWARSARTDKGVSAVGQVVSGRFYIDPPGLVQRLNSNLPSQIRIFGYKRVTGSFSAKKFCDRRRYVYLLPVFALDPSSHPDRESVLASLGSVTELVKCLECSERGRKVIGVMGKRNFENNSVLAQLGISSNGRDAVIDSEDKEDVKVSGDSGDGPRTNSDSVPIREEQNATPAYSESVNKDNDAISESIKEVKIIGENGVAEIVVETNGSAENEGIDLTYGSMNDSVVIIEAENVHVEENPATGSGFNYGEKEKERFNRILKCYVGSHNFHNFTTRTKAEDPAAWRYIVSFDANTIVTVQGIEFVKCEVVGQSFMLHQIRKMMGLAVVIMRNCAPDALIEAALQKDVNINVPTAPEVGLYLDECFFSSYNQKWKDSHEELSMKTYTEEAEDFKMKHIYSHIASAEHKEGAVALWLHSLNHRNYPDLYVNSGDTTEEKCAQVKNLAD